MDGELFTLSKTVSQQPFLQPAGTKDTRCVVTVHVQCTITLHPSILFFLIIPLK